MVDDVRFRMLRALDFYRTFMQHWQKANFTDEQKAALASFFNYVNEIVRIVAKEEGFIVSKL